MAQRSPGPLPQRGGPPAGWIGGCHELACTKGEKRKKKVKDCLGSSVLIGFSNFEVPFESTGPLYHPPMKEDPNPLPPPFLARDFPQSLVISSHQGT